MERPVVIWSSQTAPQELFYYTFEFCTGLLEHMAKRVEYLVHPFLPTYPHLFHGKEQILAALKLLTTRWQQTLGFNPITSRGLEFSSLK